MDELQVPGEFTAGECVTRVGFAEWPFDLDKYEREEYPDGIMDDRADTNRPPQPHKPVDIDSIGKDRTSKHRPATRAALKFRTLFIRRNGQDKE